MNGDANSKRFNLVLSTSPPWNMSHGSMCTTWDSQQDDQCQQRQSYCYGLNPFEVRGVAAFWLSEVRKWKWENNGQDHNNLQILQLAFDSLFNRFSSVCKICFKIQLLYLIFFFLDEWYLNYFTRKTKYAWVCTFQSVTITAPGIKRLLWYSTEKSKKYSIEYITNYNKDINRNLSNTVCFKDCEKKSYRESHRFLIVH